MSEPITFHINGDPQPQPRPRGRMVKPKNGKPFVHIYSPTDANEWKSAVAAEARRHFSREPIEGPISVTIHFTFARPLSHFGTGRNSELLKPAAPKCHTSRPDIDNCAKAVMDALTDLGVWHDDGQVCELVTTKGYGQPGATITVQRLAAEQMTLGDVMRATG